MSGASRAESPLHPEPKGIDPAVALQRVPIFHHLKPAQLAAIAQAATPRSFVMGTVLTRAGDPYPGLFVILKGRVSAVEDGKGAELGPGAYVGELAAVEIEVAGSDVKTLEPTDVLFLRTHEMYPVMRADPEISLTIVRVLSKRVREATALPIYVTAAEAARLRKQMLNYANDFRVLFESERARAHELQEAILATIRLMVRVIEQHSLGAMSHGVRVGRCAQTIARQLDWSEEHLVHAMLGGLLHDLGLIDLNVQIRGDMTGPHNREVLRAIQRHPQIGAKLLEDIGPPKDLVPYVLNHHEALDGSGYPRRLHGQSIPIQGRVMAVAEAFEEVLGGLQGSDTIQQAFDIIQQRARIKLEAECVAALGRAIAAGEVTL